MQLHPMHNIEMSATDREFLMSDGEMYETVGGHEVGPVVPTGNRHWPWAFYQEGLKGGLVFWSADGQSACHGLPGLRAAGFEIAGVRSQRNEFTQAF
jgi:hypothetical protein